MNNESGDAIHVTAASTPPRQLCPSASARKGVISRIFCWGQFRSIVVTFAFSFSAELALLICSWHISKDWLSFSVSFGWMALGFAIGSVIGTALSPYDDEIETFNSYWKSLVVFITGFFASSINDAIKQIGDSGFRDISLENVFRALAFSATLILTSKVMFTTRRYDGTGGRQTSVKKTGLREQEASSNNQSTETITSRGSPD